MENKDRMINLRLTYISLFELRLLEAANLFVYKRAFRVYSRLQCSFLKQIIIRL